MVIDELWPGGPGLARGAFPLGTDAVLLAHFPSLNHVRRICDLGSGSGVISILLALRKQDATVTGVEIDEHAAELSRASASYNGLSERAEFLTGDLREHRTLLKAGSFDLAVCNPPYYPVGSGKSSRTQAAARDERSCTLEQVCQAAAYLVRYGGRFAPGPKPEHPSRAIVALAAVGLEPKRLRMVQHGPQDAPNLFLLEARRGGSPGLRVERPLILTDGNGRDSDEICKIYHRRTEK